MILLYCTKPRTRVARLSPSLPASSLIKSHDVDWGTRPLTLNPSLESRTPTRHPTSEIIGLGAWGCRHGPYSGQKPGHPQGWLPRRGPDMGATRTAWRTTATKEAASPLIVTIGRLLSEAALAGLLSGATAACFLPTTARPITLAGSARTDILLLRFGHVNTSFLSPLILSRTSPWDCKASYRSPRLFNPSQPVRIESTVRWITESSGHPCDTHIYRGLRRP